MNSNINLKNYFKLIISLIPFYAAIGCIILWSYLDEIGRLYLFTSILDSTPSLFAITFAFTLLTISVLCIFTNPSLILYAFAMIIRTDSIRRIIRFELIPWIAIFTSIIVIAAIMLASMYGENYSWARNNLLVILFPTLYITILLAVHFLSQKRNKPLYFFTNGKRLSSTIFIKDKMLIAFAIFFSGSAIVIPVQFILNISSAFKDTWFINFAVVSLPVIFISFLPVFFLFSGRDYKNNHKHVAFSLIATLFIFIFCMLIIPGFTSIISRGALKQVGVIDTSPHIYAINKNSYPKEMFPEPIWKFTEKRNDKYNFVKGTILLSLGGKVLMCPDFVISTQNKYLKYNLDNLFSPRNEFHSRYIKQTMKSCALINSSEITPWDGIVDGENAANR